jgi:hypothetical protein
MDVLIECCCGLDVHKATIVACLLKGKPHRKPHKEVRSFVSVRQAGAGAAMLVGASGAVAPAR